MLIEKQISKHTPILDGACLGAPKFIIKAALKGFRYIQEGPREN